MRSSVIFIRTAFFILFIASQTFASEVTLSFRTLDAASQSDGQIVTIRGFLFESKTGDFILAGEPNLKTCCIGSPEKRHQQIRVEGLSDHDLTKLAVTLRGRLSIKSEGGSQYVYTLEDTTIVDNNMY